MPLPLPDTGHYYQETDITHFIVEPWNAISSLSFLIPAIYFIVKIKRSKSPNQFILWIACPLLILGGLGSTFYHAFRISFWLILADVLPILALVLSISIRTWLKVLQPKWWIVPIILSFLGLTFLSMLLFNGQDRVSASYVIRGTMLILPFILYARKSGIISKNQLVYAVLALCLALLFRYLDDKLMITWMPWGTHWLWHISTAIAAYFLGNFILVNEKKQT